MIKLLWAMLGSLGFGIIFNVNMNKLFPVMIGGFLNYFVYYIILRITNNIFLSAAFCAIVTSLYSECLALMLKCPTTIFILTGLIPSVPGSSLFYTMQNLVLKNTNEALKQGIITIEVILGIVSGMLFASAVMVILNTKKKKRNYIH